MPRPRSVRAHDEVLGAALTLFAERGIDATSVDAIAELSGVSKATIYKHWADKDALCLEVLMHVHGHDSSPKEIDSGDLRTDLMTVLNHQPPEALAEARTRLMPHLLAYGVRNPAFGKAWRVRVLEPPRVQLTAVIERAIARGVLPRSLRIDVALAQLVGPMVYSHIMTLIDEEEPPAIREVVVDAFIRSYGQENARSTRQAASRTPRGARRRRTHARTRRPR